VTVAVDKGATTSTLFRGDGAPHGGSEDGGAHGKQGRFAWLRANLDTMGGVLDPWWLLTSLAVSVFALVAGAYQAARPGGALNAWRAETLLQVGCGCWKSWGRSRVWRGGAGCGRRGSGRQVAFWLLAQSSGKDVTAQLPSLSFTFL
jgi:hypothetical protein